MGYDLVRFIGKIDKEYLCQICKLVLENPVQIPCDHLFCYDCIKNWVITNRTCPVDHTALNITGAVTVFKSPCMAFRNLLYKLDITCEFKSDGCSTITKLENLGEHVRSCAYNLNAEVVCDKGCNVTVTRREYMTNNCSSHLMQEVAKLNRRVNYQRKHFESLANCLYDRIKKLNDEMLRQQAQKEELEKVISRQQQEITALNANRSNTSLRWQICHNLKFEEPNILKIEDYSSSSFAFAQSYNFLTPTSPYFQIRLSKTPETPTENYTDRRNLIWIGLTCKGHRITRNPEGHSVAYIWNGRIQVDGDCVTCGDGPRWEDGDFIKCEIKFPKNFISESNNNSVVCLYRNDKLFYETPFKIPRDGLFPTICIYGKDTKVAYVCN